MSLKTTGIIIAALYLVTAFSSCITTKKFDAFVSSQYNDQLPEVNAKKKPANISVGSPLVTNSGTISATTSNTKVLPLLVYWKIDHRFVCSLNTQIAVANFAKAVNTLGNKGLTESLQGNQLELTVEQSPSAFSMIDKTNVVWTLLYAVHWSKVYIQPDAKDLVVSYKLHQPDGTVKTGSITVNNKQRHQNILLFQSWKSATAEYITSYDQEVTAMTKEFANKLMDEIKQPPVTALQKAVK